MVVTHSMFSHHLPPMKTEQVVCGETIFPQSIFPCSTHLGSTTKYNFRFQFGKKSPLHGHMERNVEAVSSVDKKIRYSKLLKYAVFSCYNLFGTFVQNTHEWT